jgi:hypothetical protein
MFSWVMGRVGHQSQDESSLFSGHIRSIANRPSSAEHASLFGTLIGAWRSGSAHPCNHLAMTPFLASMPFAVADDQKTLDAAVEELSPKAVAYRADVTDSNACADLSWSSDRSLDIVFANAEFRSRSSKRP